MKMVSTQIEWICIARNLKVKSGLLEKKLKSIVLHLKLILKTFDYHQLYFRNLAAKSDNGVIIEIPNF